MRRKPALNPFWTSSERQKFERLGIFTYSREEGTRAAQMMNQNPGRVKAAPPRAQAEQLAVGKISRSFVGREMRVLVERAAGEAELHKAASSSWEHGFIRSSTTTTETLKGRYWVALGSGRA